MMLVNMLCKQLGDLRTDGEEYTNVMYKSCAYLATASPTSLPSSQLLIHLLCWVPAKIFTEQSIQVLAMFFGNLHS